jgi:divalent metal cation (Fe/Co/Zn/Cd) transporter
MNDINLYPSNPTAVRHGIQIEIVTLIYMSLEAILSIGAGILAHSALLAAFGVDSLIELLSGAILLWRLRIEAASRDLVKIERAERNAARATVAVLGLLCVYILFSSIYGLAVRSQAESSPAGIGVSLAAVVFMPYLARRKRGIARELGSLALADDATASITCAYMAGTVLIGLALNTLFHWWWVEDVAALGFLFWLARETWEAFEKATE